MNEVLNCGHAGYKNVSPLCYSACDECHREDVKNVLKFSNRAYGYLNGMSVIDALGFRLGTVVEKVTNPNAKTPTGGKYTSVKMTIRDLSGQKWFANGPKSDSDSDLVILRKAGK